MSATPGHIRSAPVPVWLVTDVYPPGCGGSGWSTHALARTLVDRGHDVEVIALDPAAVGVSQRVYEGIRVTELGVRPSRRNPARRLGARDYAHHGLASYLNGRLAGDPSARVVHAQHLHSGPPAVGAARRHGHAAVQTLRDYWPVCLHGTSWWNGTECGGCSAANLTGCMSEYWGWPSPFATLMVPWARRRLGARQAGLTSAHRIIAVSEWVRRRMEAEVPADRYAVIPNIVDGAQTHASADAGEEVELPFDGPFLVAAGKLVPTKGFDVMLSWLAETGCRWPVVIAGSGQEQDRLRERALALGVEAVFPGWMPHASLLRLIRTSRGFLLPASWNEPMSRLLLEALALGAPVLSWNRGGNAEHLTAGVDAWVIDGPGDLREALEELADDQRCADVASAGRRLAEQRFSPEAVYPRVMQIYGEALTAARRTWAAGA